MITATNNNQIKARRITADDRLDALYMREMRCPYCQTKIMRGTAKCKNCGLTKEQIYYAKLKTPYKPSNRTLMSKVRPAELPLWKMVLGSVFGVFGVHNYIAKRYVRGAIMLLLTIGYIVSLILFPPAFGDGQPNQIRYAFESKTYLFPGDMLGIVVLGMWVWDFFAILFRQYKYPVQIEISEEA